MIPGIEDALVHDQLPPSLNYIKARIKASEWFVFVATHKGQPASFIIFEMGNIDEHILLGIKYAWVSPQAPRHMRRWLVDRMDEVARSQNCEAVVFSSIRKGWFRFYEPLSINFIRKLDNDRSSSTKENASRSNQGEQEQSQDDHRTEKARSTLEGKGTGLE